MKVYVVITDTGDIYSIHRNRDDARKTISYLNSLYENAVLQEFYVN